MSENSVPEADEYFTEPVYKSNPFIEFIKKSDEWTGMYFTTPFKIGKDENE